MNTGIRYIGIVICWLCFVLVVNAKTSDEILMKQYDETIFVISDFSGVDANLNEPRTIQELLDQKIGGFRFYLEWEKQQNQLMIKKADGASILSLIHISEPTRLGMISYAVFCLKKKKTK